MYVTKHTTLTNTELVDALWELYDNAYDKIAEQDVTREELYRHEFNEVLADATYNKTVIHDPSGAPIALSVIATDIGITRYLSVPFFRRRYPERLRQGRIHYVMFAVVHPDHQTGRAVAELCKAGLIPEADAETLLVFDLPESNQPDERGRGAELLHRMSKIVAGGDTKLESFGVSRYYAIDFALAGADDDVEQHVPVAESVQDASETAPVNA
ncbi:MAG: hypothetical protein AAFP84_03305 [Actinomycetota bacterium]